MSIFLTVVSFLNLSAKYITFKIAKGCSYQDISTASKSTPLKAQPSFSLSNFVTHLSSFSLFKKHSIKTHRQYLCSRKGKCVNFIYWFFFLCFSIWQILMLEPKGKIQSTLESTKKWTSRIVTIFIRFVSFLNLSENISFLKRVMYAFIKTCLQLPNLHLWKLYQVFLCQNLVTHSSTFLTQKNESIKEISVERMCKHIKMILLLHLGLPN